MVFPTQDEAVDEKAGAVLPSDLLTGLESGNWKERMAAMEKFIEVRGILIFILVCHFYLS